MVTKTIKRIVLTWIESNFTNASRIKNSISLVIDAALTLG
jgi:hypothetical protein